MNKRLVSLVLSGLIVLNNTSCINNIYASENKKPDKLIENQDTKSKQIVYLEDGEGDEKVGDGTAQRPYKNIRTALKNIEDGDTLKLSGEVSYTKYIPHTDKSALPLFINKNITIEGASGNGSDSFYLRAPIQLGANVTFKNIRIEMLRDISHRSATIYAAGYELTLDNVNTRLGTSPLQYDERPYISGGRFKGQGSMGNKSVINIVNPNYETRFSGIYAGDYWEERTLDVEINLDGALVDTIVYTGGIVNPLNGNVVVNLGGKSNVTMFNTMNHNGSLSVKLKKDYFTNILNPIGVNDLTLEEGAGMTLPRSARFNVNNVTLKNNASIDFRDMSRSPIVNGDFKGEDNISDTRKGGSIILNNDQTLDIKGKLTGKTRLNSGVIGSVSVFKENHDYVSADASSTGELSIEDSIYDNFEIRKENKNNRTTWSTIRIKEAFGDFRWVGGDDKIINPLVTSGYSFPIEFLNDQDKPYKPDVRDLVDDFIFTIKKPDGTILTSEDRADADIDFYLHGDKALSTEISDMNTLLLYFNQLDKFTPRSEMLITATHKDTNKSISKKVYILSDTQTITGTVSIAGSAIEGRTISIDTSKLPKDSEGLTYKWYVDGVLVPTQTGKDFVLTKEHLGKKVKVEVEAKNYVGSVFSSEVTVKEPGASPVITGIDDIELKVSQVDEFNNNHKLTGVKVIDDIDTGLIPTVTGNVGKPSAGKDETYKLTYSVKDSNGNLTEKVRNVKVTNQLPIISVSSEVSIKVGDKFKPLSIVSANDKEDGNITSKVVVKEDTVDTKKAGVYKVVYSVTDNDKNTVTKEIRVIVKSNESTGGGNNGGGNTGNVNISDIKGHWGENQISRFISNGYINGYSDGTFRPDNSITRAEFVKIFNRYLGLTKTNGNVFNDTKKHWAKTEIDIAVTNGVANGVSSTEFKPDAPITREEAAKMISNYMKLEDKNHDKVKQYKDMNKISKWALNSVEFVIENKYMSGYSDKTFRPRNNITRAEAVVTLSRVSTNYKKDSLNIGYTDNL